MERTRVVRAASLGVAVGAVIAVVAVLPAEYGVDPTGLGQSLGLLKLAPAGIDPMKTTESVETGSSDANRVSHTLRLDPGEGTEFKVVMDEGAQASFRWLATDVVHFDQHGEPAGDTSGYYESYAVGFADALEGKFTALFTGTHGWYWRNDGSEPVDLELTVAGKFELKTVP